MKTIKHTLFPEDFEKAKKLLQKMRMDKTDEATEEALLKRPKLQGIADAFGLTEEELENYKYKKLLKRKE